VPRTRVSYKLGVLAALTLCVVTHAGCEGGGTTPTTPTVTTSTVPAASPLPPLHPLADHIEALFLGSGPLTPRDGARACPWFPFLSGWPRGTHVRVRISTAASRRTREVVGRVVDQIVEASNGVITATLETTPEVDPFPLASEVTLTLHPNPGSTGCAFPYGCIHHTWQSPAVFTSGRALLDRTVPPQGWAHELGHGILGMCHIDGGAIGGARHSIMSGGPGVLSGDLPEQLSPNDVAATQAVYAAELHPGATRDDFVRKGLVRP
jgi:hypothetical protein